jgi:hypothetical protein
MRPFVDRAAWSIILLTIIVNNGSKTYGSAMTVDISVEAASNDVKYIVDVRCKVICKLIFRNMPASLRDKRDESEVRAVVNLKRNPYAP